MGEGYPRTTYIRSSISSRHQNRKEHSTHHLWKNRGEKNFNEDPRAMDGRPEKYQLVFKGEQMPTTTMGGK
jgi:hypothetical protein